MGLILSRIFVESFRCKRQLVKVAFEKSCPEWAQARKSCKEKKKLTDKVLPAYLSCFIMIFKIF